MFQARQHVSRRRLQELMYTQQKPPARASDADETEATLAVSVFNSPLLLRFLVFSISLHVFNPLTRRDFKRRRISSRCENGNSPTAIGFNPWNKCTLFYRDSANWIYLALPSQIPLLSRGRLSPGSAARTRPGIISLKWRYRQEKSGGGNGQAGGPR